MANTDFDPSATPPPPQQPPPPQLPPQMNPMRTSLQQLASAETPGINFTGGRMDAVPRDVQTDIPIGNERIPPIAPEPPPTPPPMRRRWPQNFVPRQGRSDPTQWGKEPSELSDPTRTYDEKAMG